MMNLDSDFDSNFIKKLEQAKGVTVAINGAAMFDVPEMLDEYARRGCDIDIFDEKGGTPLMIAAFAAKPRSVKTLLDLGADLNHVDFDKRSPLILVSCGYQHEPDVYKTIKLLLEAGADKNQRDIDGKTAYDWASDGRYGPKICELLKPDNIN